jgi:hypothetical protein
MSMEAFTSNLTLLDIGVTLKTGTSEGAGGVMKENEATAPARQILVIRIFKSGVSLLTASLGRSPSQVSA